MDRGRKSPKRKEERLGGEWAKIVQFDPPTLPNNSDHQAAGTTRLRAEHGVPGPRQTPHHATRHGAQPRLDKRQEDGNRRFGHEVHDELPGQDGDNQRIPSSIPIKD